MVYRSTTHDHTTGEAENTNMEETEEDAGEGHGHDLVADRQNVGPSLANNASCGCTGGRNWIFMVIVAGLVGLYVLASILG